MPTPATAPTRYAGHRTATGASVTVNGHPLPLALQVERISPTGGGSGPAQLALAIFVDHLHDPPRALALYQRFKRAVIAALPHDAWELTAAAVDLALTRIDAREH